MKRNIMVQQCKQNPLRSANTAATTKGTKDRLHCVGSVKVRTALLQNQSIAAGTSRCAKAHLPVF